MRNFILLLLLINFLAFAYQHWILEPDQKVAADYLEQDYPGLILADKPAPPVTEPEEVVEPAVAAAASEPEPQIPVCVRVGPFSGEDEAGAVSSRLRRQGAVVRQSAEETRIRYGFWVQVVGQANREAAQETRKELISKGFKDAYVMEVDGQYRISLGVFSQLAGAQRVSQQASRMGYDAPVTERYQAGTDYWLGARFVSAAALQAADFKDESGQIVRSVGVSCAAAGV